MFLKYNAANIKVFFCYIKVYQQWLSNKVLRKESDGRTKLCHKDDTENSECMLNLHELLSTSNPTYFLRKVIRRPISVYKQGVPLLCQTNIKSV